MRALRPYIAFTAVMFGYLIGLEEWKFLHPSKEHSQVPLMLSEEDRVSAEALFTAMERNAGTHQLMRSDEAVVVYTPMPTLHRLLPNWSFGSRTEELIMRYDAEENAWASVNAETALGTMHIGNWTAKDPTTDIAYPFVYGIGHTPTPQGTMAWVAGMVWTKKALARDSCASDSDLEEIEPDLHFTNQLPQNLQIVWALVFSITSSEDVGVAAAGFRLAEPAIAVDAKEPEGRMAYAKSFTDAYERSMQSRKEAFRKKDEGVRRGAFAVMLLYAGLMLVAIVVLAIDVAVLVTRRRRRVRYYSEAGAVGIIALVKMSDDEFIAWLDRLESRRAEVRRQKLIEESEQRVREQREARRARREQEQQAHRRPASQAIPSQMTQHATWADALRLQVELQNRIERLPEYEREPMFEVCEKAMEERNPSRALAKLKHFEERLAKIEEDYAERQEEEKDGLATAG